MMNPGDVKYRRMLTRPDDLLLVTNGQAYYTDNKSLPYIYDAESSSYQMVLFPRILISVGFGPEWNSNNLFTPRLFAADMLYIDLLKKALYILNCKMNTIHIFPGDSSDSEEPRESVRNKVFRCDQDYIGPGVRYEEWIDLEWNKGKLDFDVFPA